MNGPYSQGGGGAILRRYHDDLGSIGQAMTDECRSRWWEAEYYEMLEAHQQKTGQKYRIIKDDWPRPRLSDVLRCARMAREQSEIWALAKEQAAIPADRWDDEDNRMAELAGGFEKWFRYKNGFQDHYPHAFMTVGAIVRAWAKADFDGDEAAAARRLLLPSYYVDDLREGEVRPRA